MASGYRFPVCLYDQICSGNAININRIAGRQKTVILDAVGRVRAVRLITNTGYSIARDRDEIPAYSPKNKS